MHFPDHFSHDSASYAAYRPGYPPLFIADVAALAPGQRAAWDCATGTGQAARLLAPHFDIVMATDASSEQIRAAAGPSNVAYRVAREDDSGAGDASIDLVTVATALHWLDLPRFFGEVRRVLRPGGVIAAWCYGFASISPVIDDVTSWFAKDRVGRYWPPQRVHVDRAYRDLPFPFAELPMPAYDMTANLDREQYIGFLATWSAVASARYLEPLDPIPDLRDRLAPHWPDGKRFEVRWPLHVRVGRMA